ncbi:hypothetical protein D3C72_1632930 [compost metagenome]
MICVTLSALGCSSNCATASLWATARGRNSYLLRAPPMDAAYSSARESKVRCNSSSWRCLTQAYEAHVSTASDPTASRGTNGLGV